MAEITIKQLLEAGAHFGHQTERWNPKMAEYIYSERNGIHIIDLPKTVVKIEEACRFITEIISGGGEILFLCTKEQADGAFKEAIREDASRCGMRYVDECWPEGLLMERKSGALVIVGMNEERIAIQEARALGIPVIAVADTNCDPDEADYVIPGNDDAIRGIKLIIGTLADAVLEAKQ